jgi:hypothetical protein
MKNSTTISIFITSSQSYDLTTDILPLLLNYMSSTFPNLDHAFHFRNDLYIHVLTLSKFSMIYKTKINIKFKSHYSHGTYNFIKSPNNTKLITHLFIMEMLYAIANPSLTQRSFTNGILLTTTTYNFEHKYRLQQEQQIHIIQHYNLKLQHHQVSHPKNKGSPQSHPKSPTDHKVDQYSSQKITITTLSSTLSFTSTRSKSSFSTDTTSSISPYSDSKSGHLEDTIDWNKQTCTKSRSNSYNTHQLFLGVSSFTTTTSVPRTHPTQTATISPKCTGISIASLIFLYRAIQQNATLQNANDSKIFQYNYR